MWLGNQRMQRTAMGFAEPPPLIRDAVIRTERVGLQLGP